MGSLTDERSTISFDAVANFVINDHFLCTIIWFVLFSYSLFLTSLDIIAFFTALHIHCFNLCDKCS